MEESNISPIKGVEPKLEFSIKFWDFEYNQNAPASVHSREQ